MRGIFRMLGPVAASATVIVGLVGGFGPSSVHLAGAAPATLRPVNCKVPIEISIKPVRESTTVVGASKCDAPKSGVTPETLIKTCVQVYKPGHGWMLAAYPGKAQGTACNNHETKNVRYGISMRYKAFDHYRTYVLVSYEGKLHGLHGEIATIHTS